MQICKVAIIMVCSTTILCGCASRQQNQGCHNRGYHNRTSNYQRQASIQQRTSSYDQTFQADSPSVPEQQSKTSLGPIRPDESAAPSNPVPAVPAAEESVGKVQGVSYTRLFRFQPSCAMPAEVCAEPDGCAEQEICRELEGCQKKKSCVKSFWDASKSKTISAWDLLRCKPRHAWCAPDSCGTEYNESSSCGAVDSECSTQRLQEGCTAKKTFLPKFKFTEWVKAKCSRKPTIKSCDSCTTDDGCAADSLVGVRSAPATEILDNCRQSPLAQPLEDPFTRPGPILRREEAGTPHPPIPLVPGDEHQLRSVEPMPTGNGAGAAEPADNVPAEQAPSVLTPKPSVEQTSVEPALWPRLRAPVGRVADIPTSQTSWSPYTSSWSTSWQIR